MGIYLDSVAVALNSASSLNRVNKLLKNAAALNMATSPIVCTNAWATQLVNGSTFTATPTNGKEFSVTGSADCTGGPVDAGKVVTCTISGYKGTSQPLNLVCSG